MTAVNNDRQTERQVTTMSEFVLKVAGWNDQRIPTTWLPGVKKVQRLALSTKAKCLDAWSDQNPDYQHVNFDVETSSGEDSVVTLLWLETDTYLGPLAVEQAWLLGPHGGTVERLSAY